MGNYFNVKRAKVVNRKLYILLLCLIAFFVFSVFHLMAFNNAQKMGMVTENMMKSARMYAFMDVYTKYIKGIIQVSIGWIVCGLLYQTFSSFQPEGSEVNQRGKEYLKGILVMDTVFLFLSRGLLIPVMIMHMCKASLGFIDEKIIVKFTGKNVSIYPGFFLILFNAMKQLLLLIVNTLSKIGMTPESIKIFVLLWSFTWIVFYYTLLFHFTMIYSVKWIQIEKVSFKYRTHRIFLCVFKGSLLSAITLGLYLPKMIEEIKAIMIKDVVSATEGVELKIVDRQIEDDEKKTNHRRLRKSGMISLATLGYCSPKLIDNIVKMYCSNIELIIIDHREDLVGEVIENESTLLNLSND